MTKHAVTPWRKFWASLNGTTGHTHDGTDGQGPLISGSGTGLFLLPYLIWRNIIVAEFTGLVHIQMQISSDPAFATSLYDLDSTTTQTGWKCFSGGSSTYLAWDVAGMAVLDIMGIAYISTLNLVPGIKYYVRWRISEHDGASYGVWLPGGSI